jgi:hypothetical protein
MTERQRIGRSLARAAGVLTSSRGASSTTSTGSSMTSVPAGGASHVLKPERASRGRVA